MRAGWVGFMKATFFVPAMVGLLFCGCVVRANADRMPDFSWDTVPLYMHVRKSTGFTPDELRYLATFPLITFEKTTGAREFGSTEKGTLLAAEGVKLINPRAKILYYRNIIVHYPAYAADAALTNIPGPFLVGRDGNAKLVRNKLSAYDLAHEGVQGWWLEHAKEMCASPLIDGLFVDGMVKIFTSSFLRRPLGKNRQAGIVNGYDRMMQRLREMIGPGKLVLGNIIRARFDRAGFEYLDPFDGSYIEGFEAAATGLSREEYMEKGIAALQKAAQQGKIIAFTMSMGGPFDPEHDAIAETMKNNLDSDMLRKRFTYALAVFLVCAEKYSYFMASDGYGVDHGRSKMWMRQMPEYSYPLGAPKGPATKHGHTYLREFQHARVTVDLEEQAGEIEWLGEERGVVSADRQR